MISQIFVILLVHKTILIDSSAIRLQKYFLKNDTSINSNSIDTSWLVGYYRLSSQLKCLAECNLITSCYSVVYNRDSKSTPNCELYSKYFETSELNSMKNTHLYFKECIKLHFNFTNE